MPRFQEMVNKWAEEHEAEIEKHKEWNEQRRLHFEETIASDPRLQDKEAGLPEDGWQFELHVQHTKKKTESGLKYSSNFIQGWVPPELLITAEPEITRLLPLSREHELTLTEKYTVLAAIYDYGRKGTAKLPPWQWPDLSDLQDSQDMSNAKRCIFFESLCNATKLAQDDESWLRVLLDDIEKDVINCTDVELSQPKKKKQIVSSETRTEKCIKKIKDHPVTSFLIVIGIVIISLGAVVGGLDKIVSFWNKTIHKQVDSPNPSHDIMDTRILTATATVEITIMSGEKGKKNYITPGTYLKFAKGREALLVMLSKECTSEQTGKNSVRYTSNMSLEVPSRALKKPLSLLKQAEYLQICLKPIPSKSYILSGKAFCVFNGNIPIEITIPPQEMSNEIIIIRDVDVTFSDIR
ncbi:hypothetical protein ES703_94029 [subsurface metagenome]